MEHIPVMLSAHSFKKAGHPPEGAGSDASLQSRMPILELDCDPWREQSFIERDSPLRARIPVDDSDAFSLYPEHRWVYDKLRLTAAQGIECGAHGVEPVRYPAICKPITQLKGGGGEYCVLLNERDYRANCTAGRFWMRFLAGEQISSDLAVVGGEAAWCRHTRAVATDAGTVDYCVIEERPRPRLERFCRDWIRSNLPGHTGMVNIESIGGCIIAVHLRAADHWPDLYGRKWLDALVGLYQGGTWELVDNDRAEGYSAMLHGPRGLRYCYPDPHVMAAFRATMGISSIQLTFFEDRRAARVPLESQAMSPGDLRLAVINSFNLSAALRVRAALAREFGVQDPGCSTRATA
jgi:hypothetical protein